MKKGPMIQWSNGKRPFISQRKEDSNTSNFLTIPIGYYRYMNETDFKVNALMLPISDDVNMNNKKIINCQGKDDDDICTIENLSVYYKKGGPIDMNNNRIINCSEGLNENDVCTIKNLQSYYMIGNELNMRNQRITGVADGMALNDAVNINHLNNLSRNTFCYKSGTLTFNRYGISINHKAPIDSIAVEILLIYKYDSYVQQPIVIKGQYTLFISPVTDISAYTDKEYYFNYWKVNVTEQTPSPGLNVTEREFHNIQPKVDF